MRYNENVSVNVSSRNVDDRARTSESVESSESVDREVGADVSVNFNHHKFHALLHHLPKVDWAVFGMVTWSSALRRRDTPMASMGRKYDFFGVLRRTCSRLKLRLGDIAVYSATEFGSAGECHLHFLVARAGLRHVTPEEFAREFTHQWCEEFQPFHHINGWAGFLGPGLGKADVKPYEDRYGHRGVAYCLKREFDDRGREQERYDYVSKKLFSIIRRASASPPMVAGLPTPHRLTCPGNQWPQPDTEVSPQTAKIVAKSKDKPATSDQSDLNLVVEVPLSAKLEALRQ